MPRKKHNVVFDLIEALADDEYSNLYVKDGKHIGALTAEFKEDEDPHQTLAAAVQDHWAALTGKRVTAVHQDGDFGSLLVELTPIGEMIYVRARDEEAFIEAFANHERWEERQS